MLWSVNVRHCPRHTVSSGEACIGNGLITFMNIVSVATQPNELVPVTMYLVVSTGFALGLGQIVQLRPVAGLQLYCAAPVAFNCTALPKQSSRSLPAFTGGNGLIVMTVETARAWLQAVEEASRTPVITYVNVPAVFVGAGIEIEFPLVVVTV